ncbi:MAG: 3-phosphoshikimate 1-carboxyvinyltransferase [Ardenticatenales bacterium]|nr:3-phosphoshikimate 1-carboxyvinyltransferase [Ardenticatenales bacterium]
MSPSRHLHRTLIVSPATAPLRGEARVPGDKSISHRVLLLGALAEGETRATGWLPAEDCLATMRVLRAMGVEIAHESATTVRVRGVGLRGLQEPEEILDCGGSGTTMRLLLGILAGQPFTSVLTGNAALRRRPMGRVTAPLREMGATILSREMGGREKAPLAVRGMTLTPMDYEMPLASAQVKSALLLAGLFASGESTVREPGPARDHTERLLRAMGVALRVAGSHVTIAPPSAPLRPLRGPENTPYSIPSDPSSAAFPLVAATLVRGSEVRLTGVGVNPTRTGFLDILSMMGASIQQSHSADATIEPTAYIRAQGTELNGAEIGGEVVVRAIDEFPILAVAATQAAGRTTLRDAGELRVKESDRIASVAQELRKMGVSLAEREDGFVLDGPARLRGASMDSHMDHRLAMALAVAALLAEGESRIERAEVIDDSFPDFVELMRSLGAEMRWEDEIL